jgi:hypothetical protein
MTEEQQNDYFEIIKRFAYEDEYDDSMDFEGQLQVNKGKKTNKNQSWNNVSYKDGKKVGDTDTSEASDMEEPDQSREPNAFQKKGEPRMPGANYSTQRDDRRGRGGGSRGTGGRGRGAQQNKREYLQSQRGKARQEGGDGGYEQKRGGGGGGRGGNGGEGKGGGDRNDDGREENMYARERQNEGGALDRDGAYTKKNTNRARGGGRGGSRGGGRGKRGD